MTAQESAVAATWDPVTSLRFAVDQLGKAMPALVDACTSPDATDLAQLLLEVREARETLHGLERDLEATTAKALMADNVDGAGVRVERYRARDRKAWDHDAWKRDVRAKAMRASGLLGAQAIITADGEAVEPGRLYQVLEDVQNAHGAGAPKVTALRTLGLDASEYCETTPGTTHVRVFRLAEEGAE